MDASAAWDVIERELQPCDDFLYVFRRGSLRSPPFAPRGSDVLPAG
jgi:hypothetical protein